MSFYQEILPFLDYLQSIRRLKSYISFDMKFPSKWSLPKSIIDENQVVGFEVEDTNFKGISFVSQIEEQSFNVTLNRIAKIIKLNKERELKESLFKQTIEKLKQTFEQNDLDKLKDLYFDFATEIEDTSNLDIYDNGESASIELASEGESERPKRIRTTKKTTDSAD